MVEIPAQIQFEEMLSHTFPGFFSAITLFMLVDIWSPINLTSWAIKDITSLLSFVGFVILFGTILGVIIDGMRHSIVEGIIFTNIPGYKNINEGFREILNSEKEIALKDISLYKKINNILKQKDPELELKHQFFFKIIENDKSADAIDISNYLVKAAYRYVEFYGNTFISLVLFSFVGPFYLFQVLQTPWTLSLFLSLISLTIACVCLNSSYEALKQYQLAKYSLICGYLNNDSP